MNDARPPMGPNRASRGHPSSRGPPLRDHEPRALQPMGYPPRESFNPAWPPQQTVYMNGAFPPPSPSPPTEFIVNRHRSADETIKSEMSTSVPGLRVQGPFTPRRGGLMKKVFGSFRSSSRGREMNYSNKDDRENDSRLSNTKKERAYKSKVAAKKQLAEAREWDKRSNRQHRHNPGDHTASTGASSNYDSSKRSYGSYPRPPHARQQMHDGAMDGTPRRGQGSHSDSQRSTPRETRDLPHVDMNMKGIPTLIDWRVLPEGKVAGKVYGSKTIPDGSSIETSSIALGTSIQSNSVVLTFSGKRYYLAGEGKGLQIPVSVMTQVLP